MDDLTEYREEISRIDRQMVRLFEQRMIVSERIAAYKKEHGLPIRDEAREEALIGQNEERIESPAIREYYRAFQKTLMRLSCDYQEKLNLREP